MEVHRQTPHHQVCCVGSGRVHEVQMATVVGATGGLLTHRLVVAEGIVSFAAGGHYPTEGVVCERLAVHAACSRSLARQHIPLAFLSELAADWRHTVHEREGLLYGSHHAPLATLLPPAPPLILGLELR